MKINFLWGNLLFILMSIPFALPTPGQAATWAVYQDATRKCRLDYASSVFTLGKKDAEDFQRFFGPNKDIYFRVAGLPNDEGLKSQRNPGGVHQKSRQGRNSLRAD